MTRCVIGIQPVVRAQHYRTQEAFESRMREALRHALSDSRCAESEQKLVVYPEHVATWLAVLGEHDKVYSAQTRGKAIQALLLHNFGFFKSWIAQAFRERHWKIFEPSFVFKSLLHYKASQIWRAYQETFSKLAKDYRVTLVAGSLVLPDIEKLSDFEAPLYNISFIFGPDGALLSFTRKVYPTDSELGFTAKASLDQIAPIGTPFGRLGNMVCADGWYSEIYSRLKDSEILVQPSFGEGGLKAWERPWQGYSGQANPSDVKNSHTQDKTFTEKDAWRAYSLATRIQETQALYGVNPFLSAKIWDVIAGGYGIAVDRRKPKPEQVIEVPTSETEDTFLFLRI